MKKYLLSGLTGTAALLLMVSPVSARGRMMMRMPENNADIDTHMSVVSNTGNNTQYARGLVTGSSRTSSPSRLSLSNSLFTGNSLSYGEVTNEVNNGSGMFETNNADIDSGVEVSANTGGNYQEAQGRVTTRQTINVMGRHGHHSMPSMPGQGGVDNTENFAQTGGADAQGSVWNVVNSSFSMMQ